MGLQKESLDISLKETLHSFNSFFYSNDTHIIIYTINILYLLSKGLINKANVCINDKIVPKVIIFELKQSTELPMGVDFIDYYR